MEKLDQEIDTMRQEFESQGQKQAHDKWQARVDELQRERERSEESQPETAEH
ncbi:hypothetical protein [Aeromonas tecta]|jgi:hypothetical protein|uniref:hypothetical protein n=1 Tax=Aeromonas tecta TaxID=324617 RepID=UPI000A6E1535|nr:hypothetical protein [Aeromonas tecta]